MRVERNTGHILRDDFLLFRRGIDSWERVYTVFESLMEAEAYAYDILKETESYEFSVYNYRNELVKLIERT